MSTKSHAASRIFRRRRPRLVHSSSLSMTQVSGILLMAIFLMLGYSGPTIRQQLDGTTRASTGCIILVEAIKPIRNLHVTYRGQTYTIREGVSTVNELTARFDEKLNQKNQRNFNNHVSSKGIVWKGQILKPGDDLSKAGIQNGDKVMILPGDKEAKAVDILAIYLFLISSNEKAIDDAISRVQKEQPELFEAMQDMSASFWDDVGSLKRKDVANMFRESMDSSYHKLKGWWERPSFRQSLHDPDRIENYRKVVATNLSSRFLKKYFPVAFQKAIQTPELWRRELTKFVTKIIHFGDTILEGLLDLLLDVLKGKGSSEAAANRGESSSWKTTTSEGDRMADAFTDEMMDPSLANNLLFELSESEEASDADL